MNLFSKAGAKKLSNRVLAAVLAVVLVATQFLTTAVWSFADTSPSDAHYNVVLDADGLTADDAWTPTDSVSIVSSHALSGNAYKWAMTAGSAATLSFPATGYEDETALFFWVDASDLTADAAVVIELSDGNNTIKLAPISESDSFNLAFPDANPEGLLMLAVDSNGAMTIPAGFVGVIAIDMNYDYCGFDGALAGGTVTSAVLTPTTDGTLYLDDIGFAIGDLTLDFATAAFEARLVANRRQPCAVYGHKWQDATCTTPKTCSVCGIPDGEALGHSWAEKDCTKATTCTVCTAPREAGEHSYISDGDCLTADTCKVCEAVQPESELKHDWSDATCTAPKTCKDCGETEGVAMGHNWYKGVCKTCNAGVYDIAENFDDASVTGPNGAWTLVSDAAYPFGQALKYTRLGYECIIKMDFDDAGTADHKAIVFYYDNTVSGFNGDAPIRLRPYTASGRFATLGAGYTYYTVIDGVVSPMVITDNMNLKLPKSSKGWVVLPLPQADETWLGDGTGSWDGTTKDVAGVELTFVHYADAAIVVDQFGFTSDVAQFTAFASAGNVNLPGCENADVCEDNAHSWKDATCALPKVCQICGLAQGLPTGFHDFADATCGAPRTCRVCDITEGEPTGLHTPGPAATCGADQNCTVCGALLNAATGAHDYKAATCTAPKICRVCDHKDGEALGHKWDANNKCEVCGIDKPLYVIAENFDNAKSDDFVNGKVLPCGAVFGNSLQITYLSSLGNSTNSHNFQHIMFSDAIGTENDEALVFYYDNSASSANAVLAFAPVNLDGAGTTIQGGHPTVTVINGVLNDNNTTLINSNFTMTLPAGTSGWVMLPIGAVHSWTLWGGAHSATMKGIAGIAVRAANSGTNVILDQFGFTEDMDAFAAAAVAGNEGIPGYVAVQHDWQPATCGAPKTCKNCGKTEGERQGSHTFSGNVCTTCGHEIYTIAQDFSSNNANIGSATEGCYELVSGITPYGQALKFFRSDKVVNIDGINFDVNGAAGYEAMVFYFDTTMSGFDGQFKLYVVPKDVDGTGYALCNGHPVIQVIDGQVVESTIGDNMNFVFEKGTRGWLIVPIDAGLYSSSQWPRDVIGSNYTGTIEGLASVQVQFLHFNDAAIVLDQFGFTKDVDTFVAAAVAGNKFIPGYVDICGGHHTWVPANCGKDEFCSNCGEIGDGKATGHHTWVPATCGVDEYCSVCGAEGDDKATGNHDFSIAATCVKPGYCSVCNAVDPDAPATGVHAWDKDAPNCGYPQICTVCSAQQGTPTGDHKKLLASCVEKERCEKCGMTFGEEPAGHKWGADGKCEKCGNLPANTVGENFKDYVSGADFTKLPCASPFGDSIKLVTGKDYTNLKFSTVGPAGSEALYFWYDAAEATADVKVNIFPRYKGGCGVVFKGVHTDQNGDVLTYGHPVTSIINGVKKENNNTLFSENFTMTLKKGSSGWIILPIDVNKYGAAAKEAGIVDVSTLWSYGGGDQVFYGTAADIASIDVRLVSGGSIVLDQFGFTESMDAYAEMVAAGNEELDGYTGNQHDWAKANCGAPKTCKGCGKTEGKREGNHSWKNNACTKCGQEIYTVAQSFSANKANIGTATKGSYELVKNKTPFGQALKFFRSDSAVTIKSINFDTNGTAAHKALVFYYDATESGYSGEFSVRFIPRDINGNGYVIGKGHPVYKIIDGKVIETAVHENLNLRFSSGTRGWVVVPINDADYDTMWKYDNGNGPYTGTMEDLAGVEVELTYFNDAGIVFDQFGFTKDVETFAAAAVDGNKYIKGFDCAACAKGEHTWIKATCGRDQFCSACGEVGKDKATGKHPWKDANCGYPKTCTVCGATEGEPVGTHKKVEATCGADAYCSVCQMVFEPATGEHDWKPADCEYPKTCKVCAATQGVALGHKWLNGFCDNCGLEEGDYTVVLNFDGRNPLANSNPKATYIMADCGYTGNALILDRGATPGLNSSQLKFKPTGNGDEEALVFYLDASHNTANGSLTLYVFGQINKNGDGSCLKPLAGKSIYTVSKDGKKGEVTVDSGNGVPYDAGFEGWYIIPFDTITHDHWKSTIDPKTGKLLELKKNELVSGTANEFFLGHGGAYGSFFEMDNFGFTNDVDAFISEAMKGKINSDVAAEKDMQSNVGGPAPDFSGGQDDTAPDLSNPTPSDYNIAVDFDEKMYTDLLDHESEEGNAGFSRVVNENLGKPNFSGNSLWWDRGGDGTVTTVKMSFNPTGYSDENAMVFWIDTSGMFTEGHPITVLLYGKDADGAEVCMRMNGTQVYRLVNTKTGKVIDRVCTADGSVYIPGNFQGFVVLPFAAMESHWGGYVKMKPGTADKVWFQHSYTYNEQLYIDNIGFTHNIENFTEKALAGKLNAKNQRVDVGVTKLPMPDGAGISDTNLSGGLDGKTADNKAFHTAVNFNSKAPIPTISNGYFKLAKEGLSGYGSGLNWFKYDTELATEMTFSTTDNGLATDEGYAFWLSTEESGSLSDMKMRLMLYDSAVGEDGVATTRCWKLAEGGTCYYIQNGQATSSLIKVKEMVDIPKGFAGWVIIPYESLIHHWGVPVGQAASDQKLDPAAVSNLNLYYASKAVTASLQVDEIGFFSNARDFIESMGCEFPKPPVTNVVFNSLDRTFGEGGLGSSAANGPIAWTDSKGTKLEYNSDFSNDSYSLYIQAAANGAVHFPLDKAKHEDDPFGVQEVSKLKEFTGLGFWITTEDAAADINLSILLNNGKTVKIEPNGDPSCMYRLVDENIALTTAYLFTNDDTIHVPANFTGWVVVDTNVFETGKWDLSMLKEFIITFKNDTTAYVDTFCSAKSAVSLIVNEMNYPLDTNLLVSTDESKVTITTNADGENLITLLAPMSSTDFRDIVDVRGGYRIIFSDAKDAQAFGNVDKMSKVAGLKVYLGSVEQATYLVTTVIAPEEEEPIKDGIDIDGDGIIDGIGIDLDGDGVYDGMLIDIDGDGIFDGLDLDFDGIIDAIDVNGDGRFDGIDIDGDLVIDGLGVDVNGDGLFDGVLEGIDVNGDGIWDGIDIDWDGVVDYYDINGDGVCDGIGIDMGADGIVEFVIYGVDFDGDGLFDGVDMNGDGISEGVALDLDADGIMDGVGVDLAGTGFVNGMAIDLNGDGLFDGVDVNFDGAIDFEVIGGDLNNIPGLTFPGADGNFPGTSPSTGERSSLWVYILGAAMLCVVVAIGYYNRKVTNK
ncbi:MAG: hypothetical protein IJO76_00790 [Clostridia bacterium]|nr:hypothetical protein [Clostridia bacterium]